ncbi:unnamed protein product [Porites lobata]|uniref:Uncharacterized protein n=1 Tax=Porites lobata TaxID=104759 RepID=A0ABN8S061_9CNID|nr:unnamed protein product [Porites lobata]
MASPQIGRVESKEYYSWMRGHHAYKDIFAPVIGTTLTLQLTLQRKPENAKDPHAVAIVEDAGRIVRHIPLALSRIVSSFLKRANHKARAEICGKRINRGSGLGLELPIFGQTGRTYSWQRDCKEGLKRKR